jgi:hypothetical protein
MRPFFDPVRNAVLLIGGGKSGRWKEWYAEAIPAAEALDEALLICGFGVQVPGGAPILTWTYSLKAIRFSPSWVMDGAFLGHARVPRLMAVGPRDSPANLMRRLMNCGTHIWQ